MDLQLRRVCLLQPPWTLRFAYTHGHVFVCGFITTIDICLLSLRCGELLLLGANDIVYSVRKKFSSMKLSQDMSS